MRKAITHQDDQNMIEHIEDETPETLNVVDIDPIPQYANNNATFDLNFLTYKYREAEKLDSGIWMYRNIEHNLMNYYTVFFFLT